MIVLSGLLVLLSVILLLIGLFFSDGLGWVYFSIGTSIAAGVFLVLGALQRRGEATPAASGAAPATDAYERVTAVTVTRPDEALSGMTGEVAAAAAGGLVSVVPGRPRYHVESCRFLTGRSDVTQLPVDAARAEGYSACGVCKPDDAVAPAPEPEPEFVAEPEPVAEEEPVEEAAPAPRKRTAAAAATKAPAKRAPTKAPAKTAAPTKAPAKAATATKAAAKTVAAETAAPAKASASSVVVIPDRGKFHTEACRFVRDVPGTVTLTKASAKRQGYVPCGVCKP